MHFNQLHNFESFVQFITIYTSDRPFFVDIMKRQIDSKRGVAAYENGQVEEASDTDEKYQIYADRLSELNHIIHVNLRKDLN